MRVPKASLGVPSHKSCIWPKSDPVLPQGLSLKTCAGISSWNGWPGWTPSAQDAAHLKCLNFPGSHRWRPAMGNKQAARCHQPPSASSAAKAPSTFIPAQQGKHTFLSTRSTQVPHTRRQAAASGATARGPQVQADFGVLLSRLRVFEVGPRNRALRCQCTFYYLLDPGSLCHPPPPPPHTHWEEAAGLCNGHPSQIQRFS